MKQVIIKGIKYDIIAEERIEGYDNIVKNNNAKIQSTLFLRRPKGTIVFWATRDAKGVVTLN